MNPTDEEIQYWKELAAQDESKESNPVFCASILGSREMLDSLGIDYRQHDEHATRTGRRGVSA